MPFSAPHNYVTLIGDCYDSTEEWQVGFRLLPAGAPTPATSEQLDALEAVASSWMNSPDAGFGNTHRLTMVKVAPIGTDGRYPAGAQSAEKILTTPVLGAATARSFPQLSLCVTTTTSRSRGRGSKGRFYPPPYPTAADASGRVQAGVLPSYANAMIALIVGLAGVGLGVPSVMSNTATSETFPITGVRVGRVMDTQRRRRSSLSEDYLSVPLD